MRQIDLRAAVETGRTIRLNGRAVEAVTVDALRWPFVVVQLDGQRREVIASALDIESPMCAKHPAFEADYCPGCGTATQIRHDL